ncbi:helix-turn-helix domain-containing protein [Xenophilus sp. Marseille-Q4582]|uniref:helix-turn-helix domain-containing protein n=1 Tax=Xenophilus sp. Marseille-Q4582 TaxID=2866600 RepID=UPI001CE45903|nr:XRE family transcriptional regulator [Xenophilus sp. Marseille-Q4582]
MTEELGRRLRVIREGKGLSLAQLGELSGVPAASLSRIENNKMSPTFGVLSRVMMGLDIDWTDLVGRHHLAPGERLTSFTDAGEGQETNVRQSKARVLHAHDAAHLLPLIADVHARSLEEVGGLNGHKGEEFCYVLSGTLVLHMEGMPPRVMRAGASALFDSSTPHAYLAGTQAGTKIMIVVLRAYGASPEESVQIESG